jgi:5-methylthioadenosine/S-adenosylhomocysteine deaminase
MVIQRVIAWRPEIEGAAAVDLHIEDGTIAAIGAPGGLRPGAEDTRIAGDGKIAFPGLINAHTHAAMVLLRGLADDAPLDRWLRDHIWPVEARLTEDDVYWATALGLIEMLRGGTTQLADMYFHVDAVARAVRDVGLRATISYGIIADRLDGRGRAELDAAERLIEEWHGAADDRIRCAVSPHAVYSCGAEVWEAAVALAGRYTVPIHTHLAETEKEVVDWTQTNGISPTRSLERYGALELPLLAAHCVHLGEDDIELLASRTTTAVHCPSSNAKLASGVAPVPALLRAGVNVALGTDGAASNNNLDLGREMRLALFLQKAVLGRVDALDAVQALSMATVNGARALDRRTGTIAPGARADLVLLSMDETNLVPVREPLSALVYASHPGNVTDVIVDGRFLLRDRRLMTLDEAEVRRQVVSRSRRLRP